MFSDQNRSLFTVLTADDIGHLLACMLQHRRPAEIDWVNRTIRVLSPEETKEDVIMSDGQPMTYQNILHQVRW